MISDFIGKVYNKARHRDSSDDEGKEIDKKEKITVPVTIETPKRSRNKVAFDKDKRLLKFDRMLFSAVHYPSQDGFILEPLAEDGDALDALVLLWEPTFPGCMIEAKPIGLFKRWDEKGPDENILCVPISDPFSNDIESLPDVPPHWLHGRNIVSKLMKSWTRKKPRRRRLGKS